MTTATRKTALVVNPAGPIGRALCRQLAALGWQVAALPGKNEAALAELANGPSCTVHGTDLRDRAAVAETVHAVAQSRGPIDLLVQLSDVCRPSSPVTPNVSDLTEMVELNHLSGVYALEAALPAMLARGSGQVVAVVGLAALCPTPRTGSYAASGRALVRFMESLRPALRRRGLFGSVQFAGFVPVVETEAETLAQRIVRTIGRRSREDFYPWRTSRVARMLSCLPPWLYDRVIGFWERRLLPPSMRSEVEQKKSHL